MDPSFIRQTLVGRMRQYNENLDEAAREVTRGLGLQHDNPVLVGVVDEIRQEGRRNQLLEVPRGVSDYAYRAELEGEARLLAWYTGAEPGDVCWPRLVEHLHDTGFGGDLDDLDQASTKVVAHLADPHVRGLKKKGLVVGHVQSGKTANYTAVMAKAADAGYRLFIVLAGMHNNLRRQTQERLTRDLLDHDWARLTTDDEDFGRVVNGAPLLAQQVQVMAVVKKNASRLLRLRDWLRDVPLEIRRACPALLIDDEADQATPNTKAVRNELSRINELVRDIWRELPTSSYVGYTATPFANVFMDPHDVEELYPSDFIIDLPRPDEYFGAERIFGREPLTEEGTPHDGLDMVRMVPDNEAAALSPPTDREQREAFTPAVPPSLVNAIRYFVLAVAARWARGGQSEHSSMLIHTTHYVAPHFAMRRQVTELLADFRVEWDSDPTAFRDLWQAEKDRASEVRTKPDVPWRDVKPLVPEVLSELRVVVDNGYSLDRVDYSRVDDDGRAITETVIAIGGGTLSRGLTLEGLMVSYFTRTSNLYDTLLQMGRWFGYRPGYEDLPRIWMPRQLQDDFEFLALVETEIREDMHRLERMQVTPSQFGLRVRAHPGRLAITARSKMAFADRISVSFGGSTQQTFILHEFDSDTLLNNQSAARRLIRTANVATGRPHEIRAGRWLFPDVPAEAISDFVEDYLFHPDLGLRSEHICGWIRKTAPDVPWNVVVVGSAQEQRGPDGQVVELGALDLGLDDEVPLVNRAPLNRVPPGTANIKGLMSLRDRVADLPPDEVSRARPTTNTACRDLRHRLAEGRGLLLVYGVSANSIPLRAGAETNSRRPMQAEEHLIGVGLVFPETLGTDVQDADYYSVMPDWELGPEPDEELPEDREGDADVDGDAILDRTTRP